MKYAGTLCNSPLSIVTSLAEVWIEIEDEALEELERIVTSLAEVWIEIALVITSSIFLTVTSLAEVWIEIVKAGPISFGSASLPLRKCGLKSSSGIPELYSRVTSLAEVWIEIGENPAIYTLTAVTSLAEVWIEIY